MIRRTDIEASQCNDLESTSPRPSTIRRSLLMVGLAAVIPGGAWAQATSSAGMPRSNYAEVYLQLAQPLNWGIGYLAQHRPYEAASQLAKASAIVEVDPVARWPFRLMVNLAYGYALLALGRNDDALRVLQQSFDAQIRIRAENVMPFSTLVGQREHDLGMALFKAEFARQVATAIIVEGVHQPHTLEEIVYDESFGSADTCFTLARALHACGQDDALAVLYRDHVLDEAITNADPSARLAAEYRFERFGILLARARSQTLAEGALRKAARLNFERQQGMTGQNPNYAQILASFGVGRGMLVTRLGYHLAGPEHSRLTEALSTELIGQIIQEKGLGLRYAERANQLFATSTNPDTIAVWKHRGVLEDEMTGLPTSRVGLMQFAFLTDQITGSMQPVMPELRARGLDQIVISGDVLLPQVRSALGDDAAIGFMQYTVGLTEGDGTKTESRYARYCITRANVELRDIGPRDEIDRAAYGFRRALLADRDAQVHGIALSGFLLADLPKSVSSARHWVIDPDGALALVPFEVLPIAQGHPLLEQRALRYVTTLAQLVTTRQNAHAGPACVVANPSYPPPTAVGGQTDAQAGWRLSSGRLASGTVTVEALPDTAEEADAVGRSLKAMGIAARMFEGPGATPDALLGLTRSPVILHVASHAALFDTQVSTPVGSSESDANPSDDLIYDLILPGRRAGLVLSGTSRPSLMFGSDIARLPLQATQLAVLSGCNTGNGDIDLGEGVSSLRRSLEEAGAASTVTSLWPVPSQPTTDLMNAFYRGLAGHLPKSEALRRAKLALRDAGHLPSAWAGFLLAGDDAPLRLS